jgi:hypothetical protein
MNTELIVLYKYEYRSQVPRPRPAAQAAQRGGAVSDSGGATESPTDQSVHRSAAGGRPMVEAQQ